MGKDSGQSPFQKGLLHLIILSLLNEQDMYGYQIVQEAAKRSKGSIVPQEGSLYPVLYRLLDDGYISDTKVKVGKRMTRVYYHLEPAGRARLQMLTEDYRSVCQGMLQILGGGHSSEKD